MPALVQIRGVPDDVRRELKARAAANGESLNAFLLGLLTREAARPTVTTVLERAARRAERGDGTALDDIRAARAERERSYG